jgi:hypothetical protein
MGVDNISPRTLEPLPRRFQRRVPELPNLNLVPDSRDYLNGLRKHVECPAIRIAKNAGAEVADSFVEVFLCERR